MQTTFEKVHSTLTASNNGQESKPEDKKIQCPYLKLIKPATTGFLRFTRDCKVNGMSWFTAIAISAATVILEKGKGPLSFLCLQAPNLYRLDEVRGISHKDLYWPHMKEVKQQVKELSRDGKVSIQDLADIKKGIAKKLGVKIIGGSKIQVVLLFIKAGGDFKTRLIDADDAIRMLEGYEPKKSGVVTLCKMISASRMINWSTNA